uniref:C2H2-type domain-containing protein n=1 Tax=Trichogramma kaykai TaxID=54128 RepID=A0ABD2XF97_9HYME
MQVLEIKEEIFDFSLNIIEEKPYVLPCVNNNIPDDILNNSSYIDLFDVHQLISVQEGESSINLKPTWHLEVNKFIKDKNTLKVLLKCSSCGKTYKKEQWLRVHKKYCGKQPNLSCEHCPYRTKFIGSLRTHLMKHEKMTINNDYNIIVENNQKMILFPNIAKLFCDVCKNVTTYEENISKRKKSSYKRCQRLTKNDCRSAARATNKLRVAEEDLYRRFCDKCKDTGDSASEICKNCQNETMLQCSGCQKQIKRCAAMIFHLRHCSCNRDISQNCCSECDFIAVNKARLKKHLNEKHNNIN